MSSLPFNADPKKNGEGHWERLIPGDAPASLKVPKKRPQSVRPFVTRGSGFAAEEPEEPQEFPWALIVPRPLQGWMAGERLRSVAADGMLVAMNWLVIGALLGQLQTLLPRARLFVDAVGAPASLLCIAVLHAALITLVGYSEGLHGAGLNGAVQSKILGKSVFLATAVLSFAYGLPGAKGITSGLIFVAGLMHFGSLWTWRHWGGRGERSAVRGDARNVLIVGAGGVGQRVAAYLEQHPASGRKLYGFLDDDGPLGNGVIGRVGDLARLARKGFVDEVILAAPQGRELTRHVLREARRLRLDLEIVPELFGCKPVGHDIERVGGMPMICLHAERSPAAGLVLKRLTDVAGAGVALVLLSPLLAAIAILVRLDSPGPVLYCAPRVGMKGRLFRCLKFRTMVSNADEMKASLRQNNERLGPAFKIAGDPRITRLGRHLRRYSLDELPQLWNVMRGEMSLVGPRPHPVDDFAAYEIEHLARLDVTPGITGLWQVTARRDPSFQRGLELDREYIRTWSLQQDLRILMRTVLAVVQGSGE